MHRRIQHFTTARQCADGCACYVMWWKVYNYKLSGSNFDALSCFDCVSIPGARWHSARSMCQLVYKPLIVDAVFSGSGNSSICPDSTQCSSPLLADSIIHSGFQQSLAKRMFSGVHVWTTNYCWPLRVHDDNLHTSWGKRESRKIQDTIKTPYL